MFRAILAALLSLSIVGTALVAQAPKDKDAPKKDDGKKPAPKDDGKKAPPKDDGKKAPPPPMKKDEAKKPADSKKPEKGVLGEFIKKDLEKQTLTLKIDGKEKTFKITKDTKILGPRGAERELRLKDDVLDVGHKINVIPDEKDDTLAVEVKLPYRNAKED